MALGAYTHTHTCIHLQMKVILRTQARAWFKNISANTDKVIHQIFGPPMIKTTKYM